MTKDEAMTVIEKLQPLFPMAYLVLAACIAIAGKYAGLSDGIIGLLVGAALTRVKISK